MIKMADAMPAAPSAAPSFQRELVAALPKLRVHALTLTRNRAGAEDLVHDTVCNALRAQASFEPGSNFQAWTHRILHNKFISNLRKTRNTALIDDVAPELLSAEPAHEHRLALRELARAMRRLPDPQREALVMVAIEGMGYEELARITGVAVGTAKSRVFRARRQLEAMLDGIDGPSVADARQRRLTHLTARPPAGADGVTVTASRTMPVAGS